jgi:hypothetical protein
MSKEEVFTGKAPVGLDVHYWPQCVLTNEPMAGKIVRAFTGGAARLVIFNPDASGTQLVQTAFHRADPSLFSNSGTPTTRARSGCWDAVPWQKHLLFPEPEHKAPAKQLSRA